MIELIKTIPNHYDIVVNVVTTGNLESLLATRERYEKELLESSTAKLSNIEAHNKCYSLLPEFISSCLSLGVKVNYIVSVGNQFKSIPIGEDYLEVLQTIREESNKEAYLHYNTRMDTIKKRMISRNASEEQFNELKKIENVYLEIMNK